MWMHKFKCLTCGLHFIVCSDYRDWPNTGTTREQHLGEATGLVHCPECGAASEPKIFANAGKSSDVSDKPTLKGFMHFRQELPEDFIFQHVPGPGEMVAGYD